MTPDAFRAGGAVEQATERVERLHGSRTGEIWQRALLTHASGAPVTSAMSTAFNNRSIEDYALWRAACGVRPGRSTVRRRR